MTREEAIEILEEVKEFDDSIYQYNPVYLEALTMAIEALEQLTSYERTINKLTKAISEQEPKTGHWIEKDGYDGDTYYDCSECDESWTTIEGTPWNNGMKYCPNCGAKMIK